MTDAHHSEKILSAFGIPAVPVMPSIFGSSAVIALLFAQSPALATYLAHAIARRF